MHVFRYFFRQCSIILPLVLNWYCPGCPRVRPSAVWSAGRSLSWSSHPGAHLVVDKQEKAWKRWASDLILLFAFFCHQPRTLCLFMTDGHLCCYGRKKQPRQFTLVKHHVWLDLSVLDNHCDNVPTNFQNIFCAVVLVCGVSDSGKTSVLGQLIAGKALETVTSMIENRWRSGMTPCRGLYYFQKFSFL